jgi:hypothetical protein
MLREAAPLLLLLYATACAAVGDEPGDEAALSLASALTEACPVGDASDELAHTTCAEKLAELVVLRENIADPMLWGAQPADVLPGSVLAEATLTELTPLAWRKSFLSTFMFEAGATTEVSGSYTILHVPVRFRNMLEEGSYPYPFWHSASKWKSHEQAVELLFYFESSKLIAAVRSAELDATRPHLERLWDGTWTWSEGQQPHASSFQYLFSPANPHVARLESTYASVAEGLREQACMGCHSPDNSTRMQRLALLNYPTQALSGRRDVVRMLEQNAMPPGVGVADQVVRLDLVQRANAFAEAGDDALAFEGEVVQ